MTTATAQRRPPIRVRTHKYRLLFAAMLLLALSHPYTNALGRGAIAREILDAFVLLAALRAVGARTRTLTAGALLCAFVLAAAGIGIAGGPAWITVAGHGAEAGLYALATAVISADVLRPARVTEDTLVGALCNYLLIAVLFAALFSLIETLAPGSFAFASGRPTDSLARDMLYFSVVTLTTLGYGDVTPVAESVQSLIILETSIGVLYPSIVIARLVSLFIRGGDAGAATDGPGSAPDEDPARSHRFSLLLGAMLILTLVYPYVNAPANRLAGAGVMLAALYAVSGRRTTLAAGGALVAAALAGQWWPGAAFDSLPVRVGLVCEIAFRLLVIGVIARAVFRGTRVSREQIAGAVCIYLLIGVTFASLYALLLSVDPGAFEVSANVARSELRNEFVYYSFVTLTTTGYGDIRPLSARADSLAVLQATLGIIYPALLVARLVSLYRRDGGDDPIG